MSYCQKFFALNLIIAFIVAINAQYYAASSMGGAAGCVVTVSYFLYRFFDIFSLKFKFIQKLFFQGNQLYSHGNYIRDLNLIELHELQNYKKELIEFKEVFVKFF